MPKSRLPSCVQRRSVSVFGPTRFAVCLRTSSYPICELSSYVRVLLGTLTCSCSVNPDEANLGGYVGFIFGGLAFAGTVWSYFFIPETKGRTVDEWVILFFACVCLSHSLRCPGSIYSTKRGCLRGISGRTGCMMRMWTGCKESEMGTMERYTSVIPGGLVMKCKR